MFVLKARNKRFSKLKIPDNLKSLKMFQRQEISTLKMSSETRSWTCFPLEMFLSWTIMTNGRHNRFNCESMHVICSLKVHRLNRSTQLAVNHIDTKRDCESNKFSDFAGKAFSSWQVFTSFKAIVVFHFNCVWKSLKNEDLFDSFRRSVQFLFCPT